MQIIAENQEACGKGGVCRPAGECGSTGAQVMARHHAHIAMTSFTEAHAIGLSSTSRRIIRRTRHNNGGGRGARAEIAAYHKTWQAPDALLELDDLHIKAREKQNDKHNRR